MEIAASILQGILGLMFLGTGSSKLLNAPTSVYNFRKWHYPQWFRYVTGAWEVIAAIGLIVGIFVPEVAPFAGVFLAIAMIGAIYTELFRAPEDKRWPAPAMLLVVTLVVVAMRAVTL